MDHTREVHVIIMGHRDGHRRGRGAGRRVARRRGSSGRGRRRWCGRCGRGYDRRRRGRWYGSGRESGRCRSVRDERGRRPDRARGRHGLALGEPGEPAEDDQRDSADPDNQPFQTHCRPPIDDRPIDVTAKPYHIFYRQEGYPPPTLFLTGRGDRSGRGIGSAGGRVRGWGPPSVWAKRAGGMYACSCPVVAPFDGHLMYAQQRIKPGPKNGGVVFSPLSGPVEFASQRTEERYLTGHRIVPSPPNRSRSGGRVRARWGARAGPDCPEQPGPFGSRSHQRAAIPAQPLSAGEPVAVQSRSVRLGPTRPRPDRSPARSGR